MNKTFKYHLLFFIACGLSSFLLKSEEKFSDLFKHFDLNYLYQLVDNNPEKKEELDHMFKIEKIYNLKNQQNKKVISYCLFWKATHLDRPQQIVTEKAIYEKNIGVKNNSNRSFYEVYVHPLIEQFKTYKKAYPDWIARLYLAHDLEFLLPNFINLDVEIFVMASDSIRAQPGMMWRFLVFDDPSVAVGYVRDADMFNFGQSERIRQWVKSSQTSGFFRLYSPRSISTTPKKNYTPISGSAFGAKKVDWINMEKAMKGFILHRTLFPHEPRHGDDIVHQGHPCGFGNQFPDYGFDERFLKHVLYFEAVSRDQLTLISTDPKKLIQNKSPLSPCAKADLEFTKYKSFGPC